jgi:hypothetical protein
MNKDRLKEVCVARRNEIIGIACFMAGAAVTYTIFGKKRKGAYIATDLTIGDLGKLGKLLIQRGHNASDQVVRWSITMAKK